MLLTAVEGIVATSGPCVPAPPMLTKDARCRRLPLTSTNVWCEGKPRNSMGRMNEAPSEIGCRPTLNEGTNV